MRGKEGSPDSRKRKSGKKNRYKRRKECFQKKEMTSELQKNCIDDNPKWTKLKGNGGGKMGVESRNRRNN